MPARTHRECSIEACRSAVHAHGMCWKHETRFQRFGDPLSDIPRATDEERFWSNVDKSGGCWVWTAARGGFGYGLIRLGSERSGTRRMQVTHRFSYELAFGAIPPGLVVCHRCDNPPCVNPAHMFLGTQADNMQDRVSKGHLSHMNGNTNKTACKHGHALDEANTYLTPRGTRNCRQCRRQSQQRWAALHG